MRVALAWIYQLVLFAFVVVRVDVVGIHQVLRHLQLRLDRGLGLKLDMTLEHVVKQLLLLAVLELLPFQIGVI